MRIAIQWLLRGLLGLFAATLVYLLFALLLGLLSTRSEPASCALPSAIFITTNGQHLFLVLPARELDSSFRSALALKHPTDFIAFGWGERAFYLNTPTWDDLRIGIALHALFLPSAAAMHVFYPQRRSDWIELSLCPGQMEAIVTYIQESFDYREEGKLRPIPSPMYPPDQRFYEAKGTYWLGYTCNSWVNTALKRAGVSTAIWSPFDRGVLYHLKE